MPERTAACVDDIEVRAIREALQRYDGITRTFRPDAPTAEPDLPMLERQVGYAWLAFQASHYSALGRLLCTLLTATQHASAQLSDDARRTAEQLLAQVYQVTTSTLRKLGQHELEWLAAERGILATEATENPVLIGGAAFRLVNALRATDGATDGAAAALDAATASARRLHAALDVDQPAPTSLLGTLYLQGAMSAALHGDSQRTQELLDEASRLANRLGGDRNDYWTAFGPTNVDIHRVSTHAALRDWHTATHVAERMDQHRLNQLPRERRANHYVDVASAYALGGRTDQAIARILQADALAPKEVRCRPIARDLVHDLWRTRRTTHAGLQRLVEHIGVPA